MARIMVSVLFEQTGEMKDFEIPVQMKAADFGVKVAEVFNKSAIADDVHYWYQVQAVSLGKNLQPDETLVSAGIWDGEILLVSKRKKMELPRERQERPSTFNIGARSEDHGFDGAPDSPVLGWKKLDVTLQKEGKAKKPGTTRTFIWKRLD